MAIGFVKKERTRQRNKMRKIIDKVLLKYAYDNDAEGGDLSSELYRSLLAEELATELAPLMRRQYRTGRSDASISNAYSEDV